MKLWNNKDAPKRGDTNYDPDYKFDFIYKAIFHNVNAITKWADLEQLCDDTTWGHGGFGEKVSGLTGRITVKPGISKGGQIMITSDVGRIRPRFYIHCHKIHKRPPGFGKEETTEDMMLCEKIMPLIVGEEHETGVYLIFNLKPHFTYDKYFSGDSIMNYLG